MGRKTKIDWCDSSWNPVTGCLHGCKYCYARGIAERFGTLLKGFQPEDEGLTFTPDAPETFYELDEPVRDENGKIEPYPANFYPTLHRYRLDIPARWTKPKNIFVCSMADLFGKWVPDEWIKAVMDACYTAPQHRYLFLTKNPDRYYDTIEYLETDVKVEPGAEYPEMWFGASATTNEQLKRAYDTPARWISVEPILERIEADLYFMDERNDSFGYREFGRWDWVVIGAETGNRVGKVAPKKDWIMEIVDACASYKKPVFMKESLREIMGTDFRQEFPWEVSADV